MEDVYLLKYTKGISTGFWVGGGAKNLSRTQIEISNIFIGHTEEKKTRVRNTFHLVFVILASVVKTLLSNLPYDRTVSHLSIKLMRPATNSLRKLNRVI